MNQIEHTVAGYLGVEFQKKLMWQLLTEVEFTAKILPLLSVTYFDNQDFQKLFQIITEYYKDNDEKIPNIPNLSIYTALKQYTKSEIIDFFIILKYSSLRENSFIFLSKIFFLDKTLTFLKFLAISLIMSL